MALNQLLDASRLPTFDAVRELAGQAKPVTAPGIAKAVIDLAIYDELLASRGGHV